VTRILQGVLSFQRRIFGTKKSLFGRLAGGQQPLALFVTCSDSRINPNLLTQTEPGELFILRNAGNLVPPAGVPGGEAATVEYAVAHLKVREVMVCGHSGCGAIQGLLKPEAVASMPAVAGWLAHAQGVLADLPPVSEALPAEKRLELAIQKNVLLQMEHLKGHPAVRAALDAGALRLHGWVYHFATGNVDVYDPLMGRFVPLSDALRPKWPEPAAAGSHPEASM
jgi:carbonic anhydrase